MPSASYSFIDVAILADVRQRFAAGDALVILATDLDQVIWANGPGAALLGYPDIETAVGEEPGLSIAARRQIMATSGFPHIGRDRSLMVRLASGITSLAVNCLASALVLPDGEDAILLAVPAAQGGGRSENEIAERAIGGLDGHGQFAAFVGKDGVIDAASEGFEALGIAPQTLSELTAEVGMARDRVVKRMIRSGKGLLPAGIARLADSPARHLLIVVDEDQLAAEEAKPAEPEAPQAVVDTVLPVAESDHATSEAPRPEPEAEEQRVAKAESQIESEEPRIESSEPDAATVEQPELVANPTQEAESVAAPVEEAELAAVEPTEMDAAPIEEPAPDEDKSAAESASEPDAATTAPRPTGEPTQGHHDRWYFSAEEEAPGAPAPSAAVAPAPTFKPNRSLPAVRFVWRTDAEGRFSEISREFAEAVGAHAADVVGRRFRDVAMAFGLDPSGEISDLLERRDTWSGRSVLWPLAGTELKVPVDLAALPVYGRDRNFEGFRGFGVARRAEAVPDPEKLGLVLVPGSAMPKVERHSTLPVEAHSDEPATDPFQGEVPVLAIEPKPDRRFSDKVIRLAEHRPAGEKGLSPVERSAFREIGERLKKNGDESKANGQPTAESDNSTKSPEAAPPPSEQAPLATESVEASQPLEEKAVEPVTSEGAEPVAAADEKPVEEATSAATAEPAAAEAKPAAKPAPELKREGFLPSAFAPGDQKLPSDTSILEKLPVPVLIHSGDVLHYANGEFLTLTGYASVEQLAEAGGLDALFADSYADDTEAPHHDLRLRTGDGLEFPIEALLRSVPWQGRKALMLVVRRTGEEEVAEVAPTLQAPSEAELHARIAEMRTIIDTATDGVVLIDKEATIRSISRPAEALFALDSDEAAGKPFVSLFAMESQRAVRDYLNGLSEHGVASVLNDGREVIGREAEGRFIPLFMTIGRLPNDSGYCAVVRDITQWKRAEEELTQARAMAERASSQKTDFLARVSHEIRTPLNAIIGFSELMVDEKFGPIANDRYRDYLRDIKRSGNHVLDLVNDLLDISKIEAGQQEMAYEAVSLNDALAETVAMMQPQANRERVIIRSSFASKLPDVVADLRSVRQIALNILSNAVRYTQAGGQVIVSTAYETSGDIVMRVRDTGIGMTQAEIEQALKPFKQINSLKRPRGDGTGLGLPLTKAMVEANRARFIITSTPGEGTLVEVAFPSTRVLAE
ncbi:PAS domain S-box-containing protein [Mesorhizobium soli]|uniref:PAS domain S-box protein n=1 Tax=Pseudaminobacter soli (ex Li et al. 2025) TaxID=1295366 RepID=UPI00247488C7|nr:PAS domain S-box protein [Mesorhizobium soli]MDH6230306.1 PAS domain S-box-containing protein [Mesorhizobium soli]